MNTQSIERNLSIPSYLHRQDLRSNNKVGNTPTKNFLNKEKKKRYVVTLSHSPLTIKEALQVAIYGHKYAGRLKNIVDP